MPIRRNKETAEMENQVQAAPAEAPKWEEVTCALLHPIRLPEAQPITSITMREPDGEALEKIDDLNIEPGKGMKVGQILAIISALSGVKVETLRKLHKKDIASLGEALVPLLEGEEEGA